MMFCLQIYLPVVLCLDPGGEFAGADGTQRINGAYDIAYFRCIPNSSSCSDERRRASET